MFSLIHDQRGTATIEYVTILIFLTIGMAAILAGLGPGIVAVFQARVGWLALPIP